MAPKRKLSEPLPDQDQEIRLKRPRISLDNSAPHSEPIAGMMLPITIHTTLVLKLMSLTAVDSPIQPTAASPAPSPAPLTKQNLRLLEEMTGSKQPSTVKSTTTSSRDETASRAKTTSTTQSGFEEKLRANGVLPTTASSRQPPGNRAQIRTYLDKTRASASPTLSQHEDYIDAYTNAGNEADMVHVFSTHVLKEPTRQLRKQGYDSNRDKQWVDFPRDVGFNNSLSAPKPDIIEGYRKGAFPPTISELGGAATLVKEHPNYAALPHLALELKNKGADMHLAERQAAYDGAAMVYGRSKALQFLGQKDVHGKASVVTATTDGLTYNIFGHYSAVDADTEQTQYHQNRLAIGALDGYEDFKDGYRRVRNMQDWAREQSTDLQDQMRKDYDSRQIGSSRPSQSVASKSNSSYNDPVDTGRKKSLPAKSSTSSGPSNVSHGSRHSSNNSGYKDGASRHSGSASSHRDPAPRPSQPRRAPASAVSDDSTDYRDRYRDRRPERQLDDPPPLQYRRSDSPQEKPRLPKTDGRGGSTRPDVTALSKDSYGSRSSAQGRSSDGSRPPAPTTTPRAYQDPIVGAKPMRKASPPTFDGRPAPRPSLYEAVDGDGDGDDRYDPEPLPARIVAARNEGRTSSTPSGSSVTASSSSSSRGSSGSHIKTVAPGPKISTAGGTALKKYDVGAPVGKLKLKNREAGSK